jgi:hypothetical protein
MSWRCSCRFAGRTRSGGNAFRRRRDNSRILSDDGWRETAFSSGTLSPWVHRPLSRGPAGLLTRFGREVRESQKTLPRLLAGVRSTRHLSRLSAFASFRAIRDGLRLARFPSSSGPSAWPHLPESREYAVKVLLLGRVVSGRAEGKLGDPCRANWRFGRHALYW